MGDLGERPSLSDGSMDGSTFSVQAKGGNQADILMSRLWYGLFKMLVKMSSACEIPAGVMMRYEIVIVQLSRLQSMKQWQKQMHRTTVYQAIKAFPPANKTTPRAQSQSQPQPQSQARIQAPDSYPAHTHPHSASSNHTSPPSPQTLGHPNKHPS